MSENKSGKAGIMQLSHTKMLRCLAFVMALILCASTMVFAASVSSFTDLKATDWYYTAVRYCVDRGMVYGTSTTAFP